MSFYRINEILLYEIFILFAPFSGKNTHTIRKECKVKLSVKKKESRKNLDNILAHGIITNINEFRSPKNNLGVSHRAVIRHFFS